MAVTLNDVLKCVAQFKHTSPNTIVENIFWFQVTDLVDPTDANVYSDLITQVLLYYGGIQAHFSERFVLNDFRVTNETKKEFIADGIGGGFQGGGGAGEVLPGQDCALVLARSNKLGHTGRKYLGPFLETAFDNGTITAAFSIGLNTFGNMYENTFIGAIAGNTYAPGTAKIAQGGAVAAFTAFVDNRYKVMQDARTQRRRRPTVGIS